MEENSFFIVDVFADEGYGGNQLAVVRASEGLPEAKMQLIAREFNYSETAFILSETRADGGYDVRIFTPGGEVPFAGHPTLGTAYVLQREIIGQRVEEVVLNLKAGQIPVRISYEGDEPALLVMRQREPLFGDILDREEVASVIGLEASALDGGFPVQEVSTGLPFVIVPLKGLDALRRVKIDRDGYLRLIENRKAKAILAFSPETYHGENHLSVRMFADFYGIPEDPATGSGGGCLAGYLVKHLYFGKDRVDLRVEQGYEVGRPSLLMLRGEREGGRIAVEVGGRVVPFARGKLL